VPVITSVGGAGAAGAVWFCLARARAAAVKNHTAPTLKSCAHRDPHNNLQLVQVPIQNMTKYLQNYLFLSGSGFGSASSMQFWIHGASHNADPCGSGSAQKFTTSTGYKYQYKIPVWQNTGTCKIVCFWTLDPDLDPNLLCRSGSKEPLVMRIRADPDPHKYKYQYKIWQNLQNYLFLSGSRFGSASSMQI